MADIVDTLQANSQIPAQPHITAPDTKDGLLHTVAMQRQQLDQMGRRHQGAFAAARRLVVRLTDRATRLEAKTTWLEARVVEMEATLSQIKADGAEMRAKINELSGMFAHLEVKVAGLEAKTPPS